MSGAAVLIPDFLHGASIRDDNPFVLAAQLFILSYNNNICAAQWADHQWNAGWADNPTRLRIFIPDTGTQYTE